MPGDLLERASVSESLYLIQYTLQHAVPSALPGLKIAISSPGSPVRSQTISQPGQPKQPFPAAHAHFDSVKAAPRSGLRGKEKGKVMAKEWTKEMGKERGKGAEIAGKWKILEEIVIKWKRFKKFRYLWPCV